MSPHHPSNFNHRHLSRHLLAGLAGISATLLPATAQVAAWDFNGENTVATSAAEVFNANLDTLNTITRGAGAAASAGANSFRTVGFQNNGIATTNTDYFEVKLSAAAGYTLSLGAIDAKFAGTSTFAASPGVSSQFAYSLDGTTFTLIGSPAVTVGTPATLPPVSLAGISALQNVAASTTVTLRYYASGQTTTGGWGFISASAGTYGLAIGGSVDPVGSIPLTLTVNPSTFAENLGVQVEAGTVSIPAALGADLEITLSSADTSEATVPATVTIPANSTSAKFDITAVNDLLADGSQTFNLTATAAGYTTAQASITVDDDTDAAITVTVTPPTFAEGAEPGTVTGTVALAEATLVPVVVTLTSSDLTEATVSESVTILANESSAAFVVNAVQDNDLDGSKSVWIDATADGYTPGFVRVTVTDDEVAPTPTLSAGAIAFTGYNSDGGDDLAFVALAAIPAGEVIFFTDNEWNGLEFGNGGDFSDSNEGSLTWTAPVEGVPAGSIVTLNSLTQPSRSASVGILATAGSFNMSGGSETVYAYQGTSATAATGFLAVIASWAGDSTANTGLSANHIIVLPTDVDIAAYTGSRSNKPTFARYLDSLVAMENWITQDGSGDQSADATAPDVPFETTPFTVGTPLLTLAADPSTFSENAGASAALGTVTIPAALATALVVSLTSGDPTEATVPATATIPIGETMATFPITAVDDLVLDGPQAFNLTATAAGYTDGLTSITVTDDESPPPPLGAGAIAFTGFNADGNDNLAFVALVAIPAGEVIFFTDNEWNGNVIGVDGAFTTGEGFATWTAPVGGVAAGSIVTLNDLALTPTASLGTVTATSNFNLSGTNETVYAYQGTAATTATGFLAVIASWAGDPTANTGLSANHIVLLPTAEGLTVDIAAYTGSRADKPTFAGYLDSLANAANWITQDGSGDQSADATAPDVPFDPTAFTVGSSPGYGTWAGLHAGGGLPNEDFDGDGVRNGVEYFMGIVEAGFTATPGIVEVAGVKKISWPHSAAATGATFKVFTSENLMDWTNVTAAATDVDGKVEYILPTTTKSLFVRLEVTVTP